MSGTKTTTSADRELSADELTNVAGGQQIYTREFAGGPPSFYPKPPSTQLGANEVNENGTWDELPD